MVKLYTPVELKKSRIQCSLDDKIMILGSCFADQIGAKLSQSGFCVCVNPFGTLYNPASIASAMEILDSSRLFVKEDCIEMGAGAGKICSFHHHTSFARTSVQNFLDDANASLEKARKFWKGCNKVIVTFGTAFVWEHESAGIVSNCLKRDNKEFTHRMLSLEECECYMKIIVSAGKEAIFSVSPIRHLSQGAHANTLSKSTLHLALEAVMKEAARCDYFPAYEIMCDELRDYRFYADDLLHPAAKSVEMIWERFVDWCVPEEELHRIETNLRLSRKAAHRNILSE